MDLHLNENQKNILPPLAIVCFAAVMVWVSPVVALLLTCASLAAFSVWAVTRSLLLNRPPQTINPVESPSIKDGRLDRFTAGTRDKHKLQEIEADAEQSRILRVAWVPFVLLLGMIPVFLVVYFISQ